MINYLKIAIISTFLGGFAWPFSAAAGPMTSPRAEPTVAKLQDCRVLVVGGINDSGVVLSSAELFDPATNSFTVTGSMTVERVGHTATLLQDGRVLVVGGRNASNRPIATTEVFNPATGSFTTTGSMTIGRDEHVAVLMNNAKVLVAGGTADVEGRFLKSSELFDPTTSSWSVTTDMTTHRSRHAALLLPSGKVFVCGGQGGPDGLMAGKKTEEYDPSTGVWSALGDMNTSRSSHVAVLLNSGKVFITGGKSSELFSPATGGFALVPEDIPPARTSRRGHTAVRLPNGDVLIFGGALEGFGEGYSAIQNRYSDLANNYTMLLPNVPKAFRGWCRAVLLDNGKVLVVGGKTGKTLALSSAILYDPNTDEFSVP